MVAGSMSDSTHTRSAILSCMLDDVVGTPEMIETRKDYSRIIECLLLNVFRLTGSGKCYYTGSKAEELDLLTSDEDFMLEINNLFGSRLKVIQSLDDLDGSYPHSVFIMETENVPPGFTLLRCVKWGIIPDPKVINVS